MNILLLVITVGLIIYLIIIFTKKPTHNKNWREDQSKLPYGIIKKNVLEIKNIRNFKYKIVNNKEIPIPEYIDKKYDLNKLKSIYFGISHFHKFHGIAHSLLSFEFENNDFLTLSIEARREKGEEYSPLKGNFNKYELIYILATEEDLIKVRTNYRGEDFYLYPTTTNKKIARKLLITIIKKINTIKKKPSYYNTLLKSCANDLVNHVRKATGIKIPVSLKIIFAGYSDELAYDLGLIPNTKTFKEMQNQCRITEKAKAVKEGENFSRKIRE